MEKIGARIWRGLEREYVEDWSEKMERIEERKQRRSEQENGEDWSEKMEMNGGRKRSEKMGIFGAKKTETIWRG